MQTLSSTDAPLTGVDCSANGRYIATAGQSNHIHIWSSDGTFVRTLKGHQSAVRDVSFSPDGSELASISEDGTVKIWRRNAYFMRSLHGSADSIWGLAVSSDSQQVVSASGNANQIILWKNLEQQLELRNTSQANLLSVAFIPDQPLLVGVGGSSIRLLRFVEGPQPRWEKVWERSIPTIGSIMSVAVSSDGQYIASGSDEGKISIWNRQGDLIKRLETGNDRIWQIDFQPVVDESKGATPPLLVLAAANGAIELWRLDGAKVATLKSRGTAASWGATFSPDGTLVAAASYDDKVRLWQSDGTLVFEVEGNGRGLTRVAFSPDGQTIATGGLDATVKLWNLDGTQQNTLIGHDSFITSLAYSPDGRHLYSGGMDSQLIAWDLEKIAELDPLEYACNWAQDYLQTNVEVAESDRTLCQRINEPKP